MKISFFMPIFNGLTIPPTGMLEACINHIYDIAHEVVIVCGAAERARQFAEDGTLEWLREHQRTHPKIKEIITQDGGWPDRQDLHKASNGKFDGDYVWLLDCDEFYHEKDIPVILDLLERNNPPAMYFYANQFWGDMHHRISDETGRLWGNEGPWQRIFKNCKESYWHGMRPPEYWYKPGVLSTKQSGIITERMTRDMGIRLYHYSFVAQSQIDFKKIFFEHSGVDYAGVWSAWQKDHSADAILETKTTEFNYENHPAVIQKLIGGNK